MAFLFLPHPLCDPEFVTALGLDPSTARPMRLPFFRMALPSYQALPGLLSAPGASCEGHVLDVPPSARSPLEAVFATAGCDLSAEVIEEQDMLLPLARQDGAFDAARWRDRALTVWIAAIPELLFLTTRFSLQDIAERLPMVLSRGHSRARAKATPRAENGRFSSADITLERQNQPYTEYFSVKEYFLRHKTYSGGESAVLRRAVFMAADAVTVLPYDPARDRVLLVEQFRAAPFARGDDHPWILEPVAGRIEPGDSAEDTARKEAFEEAGLNLRALHRIGEYYPSTGCFSEYLVSFVGIADLPDTAEGLHGVAEEGEDIRALMMTRRDLLDRIAAGEMPDGPLILTAYWLELNRAKLLPG